VTAVRRALKGHGPAFWIAIVWMGMVVIAAVAGQWLPFDSSDEDLSRSLQGPSWHHPFGTTKLGVDLLALVIKGARVSLLVGVTATMIGFAAGTAVGLLTGYFRGRVDTWVVVVLDALVAFPAIVIALAVVLYFGQSLHNVIIVIAVITVPLIARVTRTSTIAVADREYVLAARMLGATHPRILVRDVLPNVIGTIGGYALVVVGIVILVEGALSFVGLGVPASMTSWGRLIAEGQTYIHQAPYLTLIPSLAIFATILALNYIGDRVQQRWLLGPPLPKTAKVDEPEVQPEAVVPQAIRQQSFLAVDDLHTWLQTPWGVVRAVDGVSFSLERGRLLAVVGESGSGKTMLARSLLGLVPSPPLLPSTRGAVWFEGTDLRRLDSSQLRALRGRRVAMIFQDPMTSLDPVMRIGDQVGEPARVHLGMSRRQARAHAIGLLESVGIADPVRRARQYPHELSGGLRQRVAIAVALSCGPSLLVADEPTSALDVTVQAQILDLLDDLRRDRNMAVILITHDLGVVASRADEVAVMYAGHIVEFTSTEELFATPRMPYTKALLDAVPRIDLEGRRRLTGIEGAPPNLLFPAPGCAFAPRCHFAQPDCYAERPVLTDGTHRFACVHPLETPTPASVPG
jgi:peptide/nickel transport system permease protein